jgi:hypothetical protein
MTSLASSRPSTAAGAATSAGTGTNEPALMK